MPLKTANVTVYVQCTGIGISGMNIVLLAV